jgi:hypothetical protein
MSLSAAQATVRERVQMICSKLKSSQSRKKYRDMDIVRDRRRIKAGNKLQDKLCDTVAAIMLDGLIALKTSKGMELMAWNAKRIYI